MSESEWIQGDDPPTMLLMARGKVSDRKLRLFAAACCRHVWHLLTDDRSKLAVVAVEQCADEYPTKIEPIARAAHDAAQQLNSSDNPYAAWAVASAIGAGQADDENDPDGGQGSDVTNDVMNTAFSAAWAVAHSLHPDDSGDTWESAARAHSASQSALLRDVVGNPFRPVAFNPRWRTADVLGLARGIYEERAFDRLPLLADALMDAGCTDEQVIGHCRSDGPHVRGCWVVDLVLGKE